MKKRILCAILSLVAVFSIVGFKATQTWFSGGEMKGQVLKSGSLNFTASGDLELKNPSALVLPGETLELKEAIVITNTSTIDTELRIRVECTYDGQTESFPWIEFVNDGDSKWYVDGDSGYIYYCPNGKNNENRRIPAPELPETTTVKETTTIAETTVEGETTVEVETTTDGGAVIDFENPADNEIPLAGTIKISGKVPVELQGKDMTIRFILEAKQADFMEWQNFYNDNGMPTTTTTTTTTAVSEE